MANTRIKDLSNTATNVASDAFIAIDGSASGTEKISRDNLRQDTADALAAAPSTYNLAPLTSGSVDVDKGGTGSTTVAGAKTNLEIPTLGTAANEVPVNGMLGDLAFQSSAGVVVDDITVDGQLTAAVGKPMPVNGPSMHFDGSYVTITSDARLSFEGSGNDLPFTFACWTKLPASSPAGTVFFSKWVSASEYSFQTTSAGNLILYLSDGSNTPFVKASTALPTEQWVHVCGTYAGTTGGGYSSAANMLTLYVDGEAVTATQTNKPGYSGMNAGSDALQISRLGTTNYEQTMRDARIFNKALSAAEVREVYSNGQLPESFAESTGAIAYAQDSTPSGEWSATNVTASDEAGPISGRSNILKLLVSAGNSTHYIQDAKLTSAKRFKVTGSYYIPSSNSNADGFRVGTNTSTDLGTSISAATLDAWTEFSCEFTSNAANLRISLSDGGSQTFDDSGGNDAAYFDNIRIVQIGAVLDARAENYNQSAGKLLDVSGNDFVGTQSGGVTLLTPRSHLSAGTLDLTNLPTSVTGLSAGEVYNDSGTLKIV